MPVAVVAAEMVRQILLELVVQGVVVTQVQLQTARLERLILAVVVEAQDLRHLLEVQAAPVSSSSKSINNMTTKIYKFLGIDTAMHLLRPGAKWEISNNVFTRWDDPRPCPSIEEVYWVIDKIREFEDSIPTIYTDEQLKEMGIAKEEFERAVA